MKIRLIACLSFATFLIAQTAGTGFDIRLDTALGGSGFNNDDNAAGIHLITNRSDNNERIDLDGDGLFEVIVLSKNAADDIHVYEATADNSYSFVWGFDINSDTASLIPQGVAVGDSDGDGLLEIVHVNGNSDAVNVFEMAAGQIVDGMNPSYTPSFSTAVTDPTAVQIGDLDGDGRFELLISSRSETAGFVIFETTGDDTYAAAVSTAVGDVDNMNDDGGAASLSVVADLDGDTTMEIVLAPDREARINDAFYVFSWDGATFTEESQLAIATTASLTGINNVLVYDIDGAGSPEIVLTESVTDRLYIYESTAANTYAADAGTAGVITPGVNIFAFSVGDRDADGFLELYLPVDDDTGTSAYVTYFEHDGTVGGFGAGNFGSAQFLVTDIGSGVGSNDPRAVTYAQGSLDGDSFGDVAVTTQNGELIILESNTGMSGLPVDLLMFTVD